MRNDFQNPKNVLFASHTNVFRLKTIVIVIVLMAIISCKNTVEVPEPVTGLVANDVFTNNSTAAAALTGIYSTMMSSAGIVDGPPDISFAAGLSADELRSYSSDFTLDQLYSNSLSQNTSLLIWSQYYNLIYAANSAINGLSTSTGVTLSVKNQLTGEAEFIRALLYFYLTNLYGDVPLITSTNYQLNAVAARTSQSQVYKQIIADLLDAQKLLNSNFLAGDISTTSTERIRPTTWAATALLARVYLYQKQWSDAQAQSTKLINNNSLFALDSLNGVFIANSTEAIWQLHPVIPGYNTFDGYYFILTGAAGLNQPTSLSNYLLSAFEPGDKRRTDWIDSIIVNNQTYFYPYKYKVGQYGSPVSEYLMVLRLSEQYLIRAEAEANGATGGLTAAVVDLNKIRNRAGLPNYSKATDSQSLLNAIYHERQVELFTEWGHRWLDLKRTGLVSSVLGSPGNVCNAKGGTWNPDWALYPIPQTDILLDKNLSQNPGY